MYPLWVTLWCWLGVCTLYPVESQHTLEADGCERGWVHYEDYCYLTVHARMHFDSAKAVCAIKQSELVSLWNIPELNFVLDQLNKLQLSSAQAWIGTGTMKINQKRRWGWLDGSGSLDLLQNEYSLPPVADDICGSITSKDKVKFVSCDVTLPAFVCKKPIHKLYIPDIMNVSANGVYLAKNRGETIFERLWPPVLEEIRIDLGSNYHLATVDVAHETDCAYRCYTIYACNAFIVTCRSERKCNIRQCSLLAGFDKAY